MTGSYFDYPVEALALNSGCKYRLLLLASVAG